jgi:hypothetical protein
MDATAVIKNEQDPIFDKRRPVYGKDYDRGWFGFNHSTSWMSQLIGNVGHRRRESPIVISHAFVVTGEDLCVEAAFKKGVLVSSLTEQYFEKPSRYVVFRKPKGLTPELADRICELAESQVGTRFDNGVLIAHTLNDHFLGWLVNKMTGDAARAAADAAFNQKDEWICSELAAFILNQIPQYAGKGNLADRPGMLTPQELFENDEIFEPLILPDGRRVGARELQYEPIVEKEPGVASE